MFFGYEAADCTLIKPTMVFTLIGLWARMGGIENDMASYGGPQGPYRNLMTSLHELSGRLVICTVRMWVLLGGSKSKLHIILMHYLQLLWQLFQAPKIPF